MRSILADTRDVYAFKRPSDLGVEAQVRDLFLKNVKSHIVTAVAMKFDLKEAVIRRFYLTNQTDSDTVST